MKTKKLNGNDLMNIDCFLMQQQRVINQPKAHKKLLRSLRIKIAEVLAEIEIKIGKGK